MAEVEEDEWANVAEVVPKFQNEVEPTERESTFCAEPSETPLITAEDAIVHFKNKAVQLPKVSFSNLICRASYRNMRRFIRLTTFCRMWDRCHRFQPVYPA